jgi:very-short-patch-repair endonuclease
MDADKFLRECADKVGRLEAERFIDEDECAMGRGPDVSPLERMVYTAIKFVQCRDSIPDSEPELDPNGEWRMGEGVTIFTQEHVGKYRVDFIVEYCRCTCKWKPDHTFEFVNERVVVECDSQEWHDRTPEQRKYEKQRERFLTLEGHKQLHYTGREIHENPIGVAVEILKSVGAHVQDD